MKIKTKIYIITAICIVVFFIVRHIIPYYSPAHRLEGLDIQVHEDDTIRIAYIGDSWAYGHRNMRCIIDSLLSNAIGSAVEVRTAGISGLTSKNVYYGLFRNDSMKSVIEWGPDFCFVVAGINDSDRKMGVSYYKENMRLIIELLLEHHITPVILEIPSYNIKYSFKRRNRFVKMKYLVSMFLTCSNMDCIDEYRKAYNELIEEKRWYNKVITIRTSDWNPNGYKDKRNLYDEGQMHLNNNGYHVLDSCIASEIIKRSSISIK